MLLRKIKFHDFRQFYGDQEIDFTIEDGKNTVVVLGDITSGKSTLILSFIWCLYGKNKFNRKLDILNKKRESYMSSMDKEEAWVEVEFEDSGKIYVIKRTQSFTMQPNGTLLQDKDTSVDMIYTGNDGQTSKVSSRLEINRQISSILPEELSSYFFFEGEKDNNLEQKDLKQAVKTLMGMDVYENALKHLYGTTSNNPSKNSVIGYYREKQKEASSEDAQAKYDEIEHLAGEIEKLNKDVQEIKSQIDEYEAKSKEVDEKRRKAEPTKELQNRLDDIKKNIVSRKDDLECDQKDFISEFGDKSVNIFIAPFITNAKEKLKEMKIDDKGLEGLTSVTIKGLLKRKKCLCGTDLFEGSPAYRSVSSYLDYVPPKSIGSVVNELSSELDSRLFLSENATEKLEGKYSRVLKYRDEINELQKEEKLIKEKLKEIEKENGNPDIVLLNETYNNCQSRIKDLTYQQVRKRVDIEQKKSQKEKAEKEYAMLKAKKGEALKYEIYYKYACALYERFKKNYEKYEKDMKEKLTEYIIEMFNSIYAGKRELEIDDKYQIALKYNGKLADESGGLRVIKYFSFVGGLAKLAADTMRKSSNDEKLGEVYPLVLDAAFSNTDEGHTERIARELSKNTSQLVLAIKKSDWSYAKAGVAGRIASVYELEKIDEIETQIKKVSD